MKYYAPYIDNILPAFLYTPTQVSITIPFEHHQIVSKDNELGFALQIKDALLQDEVENQIIIKPYDDLDSAWTDNYVTFTFVNPIGETGEPFLKKGRFYKISIAYVDDDDEIGYWSSVGISKCTAIGNPTVELSADFTATFTFPYTPANNIDIEEKLYSVSFALYDGYNNLLEQTEDIIINYQTYTDTSATIVNYQFNTYFSYPTFQEIVADKNLLFTEIMTMALDANLVMSEVNAITGQLDYYIENDNNKIIIKEYNDSDRAYSEAYLYVAEQVYQLHPENWAETYNLIANYTTINNYFNTVASNNIRFSVANSNTELLVCVEADSDNGLINITFQDATVGEAAREQALYVSDFGKSVGTYNVQDLIDKCSNFRLLRKNLITQQCICLLRANYLPDFYYKDNGYQDLGIEQGITYEYILTYNYKDDNDQIKALFTKSAPIFADFEDCFLYDVNSQLKLCFNPKISSYKYVIPQTKQETIGGKYPYIFENRNIRYKEFPISFLISYLSDSDNYFAKGLENKYSALKDIMTTGHFDKGLTRYLQTQSDNNIAYNYLPRAQLDGHNIFIERQFKMAVMDWLTNGKPKIFKSPTEGNTVVKIINISMAPEDRLGRMLHTLSGTAIEIEEYNDKYLQNENLLLYQTISNRAITQPVLSEGMILLEERQLSTGGLAHIYSLTDASLISHRQTGYYLRGKIIRSGDDIT